MKGLRANKALLFSTFTEGTKAEAVAKSEAAIENFMMN